MAGQSSVAWGPKIAFIAAVCVLVWVPSSNCVTQQCVCSYCEELRAVEQYYKMQEVQSPVQRGFSKGPPVHEPRTINVDRSDWYWRKPEHQKTAKIDQIVLPFDGFEYDREKHLKQSYVIENKRFVEDLTSRCGVNTIPENPMAGEPSFILISPAGDIRIDATAPVDLVKKAGFDSTKNTIIIVHGYTQSYTFSPYLRQMRVLFDKTDHVGSQNLILMDYSAISWNSYQQTSAETGVVSSFLANFVMKLLELGADPKSIHMIGNSIGGHVAALAAKRIHPKIGRITSLDSAGPCFGKWGIASDSPHHRLAVGDAHEVVVFHYDDRFLGTPGPHGDIDIYVNDGSHQPGCSLTPGKLYEGLKSTFCKEDKYVESSHTRGQDLVTAALPDWCQQVAYECTSYESFSRGECGRCDDDNEQCYLMSMYFQFRHPVNTSLNPPLNGKRLYISTGPTSPFCSNHYQILVDFSQAVEAGKIKAASLELVSDNEEPIRVTLTNRSAPRELSYLLLIEKPPVKFNAGKIKLQPQRTKSLNEGAITVRINFMSNIDPKVRHSLSSSLCLNSKEGFGDNSFKLVECT